MKGGIFLLLCLLALVLGSRARNAKYKQLSQKEIKRKELMKQFMRWGALVVISFVLLGYIPFVYQEIRIAIDTQFILDTYLSIVLLVFGGFTLYTVIKAIRRK